MNFENECFQIILHGGNAKSLAFEALELVKNKKSEESKLKIDEAKSELITAQREHAKLLKQFVIDEKLEVSMLLVHAEDHMASSQTIVELSKELITIYERLDKIDG